MRQLAIVGRSAPPLSGAQPFPYLDDWLANSALIARRNLLALADGSPACHDVLDRLERLDDDDQLTALLRPEIFAFVTQDPAFSSWDTIPGWVAGGTRPSMSGLVWKRPSSQMISVLRRQGQGSRGPSCEHASAVAASSPEFVRWVGEVGAAIDLISDVAPGYAADLRSVTECVVLVDEHASFRGASGAGFRGLSFFSPDPSWTTATFAEELVHEATHMVLDLVSLDEPLIAGVAAFEARYEAPFRPDPRPLYGNFHAVVVVARLVCLFAAFAANDVEPEVDWAVRATDYARRSIQVIEDLKTHADMSQAARHLFDDFVVPVIVKASANA